MKTLLLAALLSLPFTASAATYARGARCHDSVCFEAERAVWHEKIAQADGKYAHQIDKMLAAWTAAGFPSNIDPNKDFIFKRYIKFHKEFLASVQKAGQVWFFEVQGQSQEDTKAMVVEIVNHAESNLNEAVIDLWTEQAGL